MDLPLEMPKTRSDSPKQTITLAWLSSAGGTVAFGCVFIFSLDKNTVVGESLYSLEYSIWSELRGRAIVALEVFYSVVI